MGWVHTGWLIPRNDLHDRAVRCKAAAWWFTVGMAAHAVLTLDNARWWKV